MTDKKIINFDKLKEKWDDKEIDKFEEFMNLQTERIITGQISIAELIKSMKKYQVEHNITNDGIMKLQKKMIDNLGLNIEVEDVDREVEEIRRYLNEEDEDLTLELRNKAFFAYYSDRIENKDIACMELKNEKNNLTLMIMGKEIIIYSEKRVDFSDDELNGIVALYKESIEGGLKIITCEATKIYEYH